MLDLGPYYITNLIQLIGPVKRVAALSLDPGARSARSSSKPRAGEKIPVTTPTTIHALLEFENGAVVTLQRELGRLEPRPRADGALRRGRLAATCPIPNFFGGEVRYTKGDKPVKSLPKWDHPFGVPNEKHTARHDGQLPHRRPCRHGAGDHARAGRTAARSNSRCTPST